MSIDWEALQAKFHPDDLEWKIQTCGKSTDGVWAYVACYITNRAVQERLDRVLGPENWQNDFKAGPDGGVLCGISVRTDDGWITKWDGAPNTDIEGVKGGLSGAMKRAAVQLGLGRYLYDLELSRAQIVDKNTKGAKKQYKNDKKGIPEFYWLPPQLPLSALPDDLKDKALNEPPRKQPPANANGRTPSKRSGNDTPANASSDCAKALSAIRNCFDLRKLQRYQDEIRQRIENGATYTADDVKLLEAAIVEAEQRLNAKREQPGSDEPDPAWLKSTAKELGCPADMLDMMAVVSAKQANPAEYLATRPWLEAAAT